MKFSYSLSVSPEMKNRAEDSQFYRAQATNKYILRENR